MVLTWMLPSGHSRWWLTASRRMRRYEEYHEMVVVEGKAWCACANWDKRANSVLSGAQIDLESHPLVTSDYPGYPVNIQGFFLPLELPGPSEGIRAEHDLFELVHKRLIGRSPSLQHLSIRYRNIGPKVYADWSHELPLFLEDAPLLPSLTGTLKLEIDFNHPGFSACPPPFEEFVNAYLKHRHLSEKINSFQLGIICSGEWGNNLAGCHWHGMDARLSNEMRFPHLKSREKGRDFGGWIHGITGRWFKKSATRSWKRGLVESTYIGGGERAIE
ncbi:hypothetical protein BKA70DRAFT_1228105 [Coprinopsis sp. MPI-PUGE-AT-0042]|nr:hypothetical protein BKA70DRAFT_1228105 [Coprinopsis sp. MPI-PUGE-AT-0042]